MPTGTPTKMKQCSICRKLFLPKTPSSKICDDQHHTNCPICGKQMIWNTTRKVEPCSKACRKERTRRMYNVKYGCDHPMKNKEVQAHHKKAMLDKYGVDSPLKSDVIRAKIIETNRDKFGSEWALGCQKVRDKSQKTMIDKYGAPYSMQSSVLKDKIQQTMAQRYGQANPMKIEKFKQLASNTCFSKYGYSNVMQNMDICMSAIKTRIENYGEFWPKEIDDKAKTTFLKRYGVDNPAHSAELMDKAKRTCEQNHGVPYGCLVPAAQAHVNRISKINIDFHDRLQSKEVESEFEFYLDGKFYDLYVPSSKTLIEINPTCTHNVIKNPWYDKGVKKDYHLYKSITARENGYNCIHIFDWDDWNKVIDLIVPKTTIYARNCRILKLSQGATDEFLRKYHLQGTCRGQTLSLGLICNNELVEVITFGLPRYNKNYSLELLRLCSKSDVTVIGGASKLFTYAINTYELSNVVSYCDMSKFSGAVYEQIGFEKVKVAPPQEIWSKDSKKITANLLRQRGYDQLFHTNYGKGASNEQLMLDNGWLPVYDCGQYVFEYR